MLGRLLSYFDPGSEGFVDRWIVLLRRSFLAAALLGCGAVALASQTPLGRYLTAFTLIELDRPGAAEGMLRNLIAERPNERFAPYAMLTTALRDQDRLTDAYGVMTDASERFPGDPRAQTGRCDYGLRLGLAAEVQETCARAARMQPQSSRAQVLQALAYEALGRAAEAVELLQEVGEACRRDLMDRTGCRRAERELERLSASPPPESRTVTLPAT